ncbi:hypothetical protein FQA39_LY08877 [Lamprigera yunnana]|nr:hypothetical protein FQA39_LY08877 [Lamprigera yunnana]
MQTDNTTDGIYSFDGVLYQVIETTNIHKLIAEDAAFAANYINQNLSCLEIIGVDREDEVAANNNTDAAFAANYINQNLSCLEIIGVDREDEVAANNNTGSDNTTKELFAYEVVNY